MFLNISIDPNLGAWGIDVQAMYYTPGSWGEPLLGLPSCWGNCCAPPPFLVIDWPSQALGIEGGQKAYTYVIGLLKVIKIEFKTESHSIYQLLPNNPTSISILVGWLQCHRVLTKIHLKLTKSAILAFLSQKSPKMKWIHTPNYPENRETRKSVNSGI